MKRLLALSLFMQIFMLFGQTGSLSISIKDKNTQKALPASILLPSTAQNFSGEGEIILPDLPTGTYNLEISSEGYQKGFLFDIEVVPNQTKSYSVDLIRVIEESSIEQVNIKVSRYRTTTESPVSLRNITSEEVAKNAGSNRDVSKAVVSFPGVATTASFRNDLFIRGGSSAENKFYIDGIEVPVINHFQTQGASGGPRGIITVDFIKDVDFYSSAFPANRNGVLSSLFEFNFKNARKEKMGYKAVLGLDDIQLMTDGPLSKDESWTGLFSVRKSTLQLLFQTIGLPFLPSYYDAQFKVNKKFKNGNEFYVLSLGAIDEFKLNLDAEPTPSNISLLERLPVSPQWNYTFGAGYKHLAENGFWLFTASRNMLDNQSTKYYRNIETPENLLLDYSSREAENKLRAERRWSWGNVQMNAGANFNAAKFTTDTFRQNIFQSGENTDEYSTLLNTVQYGAFVQSAFRLLENRLKISLGTRIDGSGYSDLTSNPFEQFSPRLALSYALSPNFNLNLNSGIYYQLPAYTALGFMQGGEYVNKETLQYIKNTHYVGGVEYNGEGNLRLTAEAYLKNYSNYPFSLRNQISLANVGGDFGVVGAEPLDSRGTGKTYGFEFLAQKRTSNNFYGIAAYTLGFSQFSDESGVMLPSSWDSRHIVSLTGGKYFRKNWNLGARFRLQSGVPETPYDLNRSSLVDVWNITNGPLQNYVYLNTLRGNTVHQLDIRAEKKWIFNKFQLTAYMDVVNVYGSSSPSNLPVVNLERDASGNPIIANPQDPAEVQRYVLKSDENDRSTPLPYFGLIAEF